MNKFKSENCLNRRQRGGTSDVGVGIVVILTVGVLPRLNGIPTELYFSLDRRFVPPSSWGQIHATWFRAAELNGVVIFGVIHTGGDGAGCGCKSRERDGLVSFCGESVVGYFVRSVSAPGA